MSQRKKQKVTITDMEILNRLERLGFTLIRPDMFLAFVGLQLVANGRAIPVERAANIIKKSKLNLKLRAGGCPVDNILEGLVYITIYKRELLQKFFDNKELEVWQNEITAPIFDILEELSRIYKI